MTAVLKGVRILEVAEHTFVPAASALLSDWGAEVIKIEHVERGDAMRGLASTGLAIVPSDVHALLEHSNRGKHSLGLDLTTPDGLEVLYKLAATSDVFLTNKLPSVREKLNISVEQIRAHNERIIYVRGTGQGERGPDADKGAYDSLAFWARAGVAMGAKRPEYDLTPVPPAPGFGDSIGAMTIAGGIMGALFHRERTGEATIVDVSLLGVGLWAMGQAMALSLVLNVPWAPPSERSTLVQSVVAQLRHQGRARHRLHLPAGRQILAQLLRGGGPSGSGQRRTLPRPRLAHGQQHRRRRRAGRHSSPRPPWTSGAMRLEPFTGQWAMVQNTLEAADDPQTVANGYLQECQTASGTPFRLVAAPVQFDEEPAVPQRAPEFNEHGDSILADIGLDIDAILDLKIRGIVA